MNVARDQPVRRAAAGAGGPRTERAADSAARRAGSRLPAPQGNPDHEMYDIGAPVSCEDGPCGELSRVVVDPIKQAVTHLVVEPHHRHALGRLVPVAMVDAADGAVRLRCTLALFHTLQYVEETEFLPADDPSLPMGYLGGGMGYPAMMAWPHYAPARTMVSHERVPLGEVEIRRGEHVHAADGGIGKVQGLVVDPADQHVTHVLLQEGHLWGAKDVGIPISAVASIDGDGVHVSMSKHAIGELPAIELTRSADRGRVGAGDPILPPER
jgi:sporulation protein YlmC with PRC-barrel domain